MKYLRKFNEDLDYKTYLSAADKLAKYGHEKRPEELRKWGNEVKKKGIESLKNKHIEQAKELGLFEIYITKKGSERIFGNFYIDLIWNDDRRELDDRIEDFKEEGASLWLDFSFGLIPADDETYTKMSENMSEYSPHDRYPVTWWVNKFWMNISSEGIFTDNLSSFYVGAERGELTPTGSIYLNDDLEEKINLKFKDRKNTIKFVKTIKKILDGDIDYKATPSNPGGMKEKILEYLIDEGFSFEEFLRISKSLSMTRLNKLYAE